MLCSSGFVSRLHRRGKSGVHSKRRTRGITGAKSDAYDCVVIYLYDTYEGHFYESVTNQSRDL